MLNLDTHIVIFLLTGQLTEREQELIATQPCGISQIVIWEIAYLNLLGRINIGLQDQAATGLLKSLTQWPITVEVCARIAWLDFDSDPADEIIAATSIAHNVPLLTRDKRIRKSKVTPLA